MGEFRHTILPSITLAMMPLAQISRLMRSGMLEILNQDYLKTAGSKGLTKSVIIMKHAVRNAILPIISILGTTISNLLAGSFVVEKIFGIPGIGMFFVNSVFNRDYTLIMGVTVFYAIVLITMMFLVDIAYTLIDPRIRLIKGAIDMGGLAFKQDMFEKVSRKSHKTVEIKRPTIRYWEGVWHRLRQNKLAMTGLIILIIMGIMSIVGTRISGYRYYEQDLTKINQAPNSDYRFGTDELGRDLFSRVWLGTRYSLIIGICAALIDFLIGVLYGELQVCHPAE